MRFLWSDFLWLLVTVPILVAAYVYALRRRKRVIALLRVRNGN